MSNYLLPVTTGATFDASQTQFRADAIVIGSGAGGAVAAYELARAGRRVIILEAGPYVPSHQFTEQITDTLLSMYVEGGGQTNRDGDLNILQGRCVGGSTVVNGAAAFRTPEPILRHWAQDLKLPQLAPERLKPYFEKVEKHLSVHVNEPHERSLNARMLELGCDRLGIPHKPLARNVKQCALTGFCLAGCKSDRKQSMLVTYLPWAIEHYGARLFADTEAMRIRAEAGRVTGVDARLSRSDGSKLILSFDAPLVILAAGAIQTPMLLQKSKLALQNRHVGQHLAVHPSFGVIGRFKERLDAWIGATMGTYIDAYSAHDKGGFIIETGFGEPSFMAGLGDAGLDRDHADFMLNLNKMAAAVVLLHDPNHGTVTWSGEKAVIDYALDPENREGAWRAMEVLGEIYFAAGAETVYLPGLKPTPVQTQQDLTKLISEWRRHAELPITYIAYHPQGTCRMGQNPDRGVVDPNGQCYDVKGLYITDASILPSSVQVNPQITIYALAHLISEGIIATEARRSTPVQRI